MATILDMNIQKLQCYSWHT